MSNLPAYSEPSFLLQVENQFPECPAITAGKLLSHTIKHQHHNELWPHELWNYQFDIQGTSWENLPDLPMIEKDEEISKPTSPSQTTTEPSEPIRSPGAKSESNEKSRFPCLSKAELTLAKPHPNAIFCPIEWKWASSSNDPVMLIENQNENSTEQDGIHIEPTPDSIGHHFFQIYRGVVEQARAGTLHPNPISIFGPEGQVLKELIEVKEKKETSKLGWDAMICYGCRQGIAVSPVQAAIPSVFPKTHAEALISQARSSVLNQSSSNDRSAIKPEQAVHRAWHTVFIVIQNALIEGKHSPLPLDGKSLSGRMPWNPISESIWSHLGARRREDNGRPLLVVPSLNVRKADGRETRAKWIRALIEVSVFLRWMKIKHPYLEESLKTNYQVPIKLIPAHPQILQTIGGDQIPRVTIPTSWKSTNGQPPGYPSYAALGILPDMPDEVVIYSYKLQCSLYPMYRYRFFEELRHINGLRGTQSELMHPFVSDLTNKGAGGIQETEEAWSIICGKEHEFDLEKEDQIAQSLNTKLESTQDKSEKIKLRDALRTLSWANPSNQLLQALLASTASLGDVLPEIDDELLWMAYEFATSDQPGQKKILRQAIGVIAQHRHSYLIKTRLAGGGECMDMVPYGPVANTYDIPVGLNNIGNSLLQYFFSVKELRDVLLRFPEYAQSVADDEPAKEGKRVGGRVVSKPEVDRSKQFASQLQNLFQEMIHTRQSALAFLALVLPKDESPSTVMANNKNNTSSASTDATLVDERSTFVGPLINVSVATTSLPLNSPSSTVLGKRKSESSDTEDDTDHGKMMDIDNPSVGITVEESNLPTNNEDSIETLDEQIKDAKPSTCDKIAFNEPIAGLPPAFTTDQSSSSLPNVSSSTPVDGNSRQDAIVIDLTEDPPHGPPPLPPRPIRSRSLAVTDSRQNDVSECMDNCLFQIQAALDETKLSASYGEEGNIVKSLFYGRTRQSLTFDSPEGKVSVKEEPFAYLLVDVAEEGRDLYDGLDRVFDESEVDVENGKAIRRVGLVHLPPILQIQLQRVQFDRSTHTVFKSNAYIKFEERLRMDRYLEPDPEDQIALERRAKTIECRKEIESLRGRYNELTANVNGGGKRTSSIRIRLPSPVPSLPEFFGDILNKSDIEFLSTEANAIEEEIKVVNERVRELKEDVNKMWQEIEQPTKNVSAEVAESGMIQVQASSAEYRLVSLFMHRGTASGGHYWAIQRQLPEKPERWLKYNDSVVSEVDPLLEVFNEANNSSANPYWLTYVRVGEEKRFEMLKRELLEEV
ncbi:ubiquitin carboxyl-terminal hydrolase [Melampsora americana]|nr:ubiquitin carboxyl-terminal hydrolase [Melampsora americana]